MVPRENFFTGNKSFRGFRIRASRSLPPSPRDKRHISLSKGGMGSLWGRKVCEKKKKTLLSFAAPPRQNSRWFCPPGNARNRMQKAVFMVRIAGIVVFGLLRTNFFNSPPSVLYFGCTTPNKKFYGIVCFLNNFLEIHPNHLKAEEFATLAPPSAAANSISLQAVDRVPSTSGYHWKPSPPLLKRASLGSLEKVTKYVMRR